MPTVVEASQGDVFSVRPARDGITPELFMPSRSPLWTRLGAEKLADQKMRVKIHVSAAAKNKIYKIQAALTKICAQIRIKFECEFAF